jgi:hypothetical protein
LQLIKPCYRASFEFPKQGKLNPAGWLTPGAIPVEIYQSRADLFKFRDHQGREWVEMGDAPGIDTAKALAASQFENQLSPWVMWYAGLPVDPREVIVTQDRVYLKEPEDKAREESRR